MEITVGVDNGEILSPRSSWFGVISNVAHVDGRSAEFSSHLAAFEACMRVRHPTWKPVNRDTFFANDGDVQALIYLRGERAVQ